MNLNRAELKTRAKSVLSEKYWPFFFVSLLQYIVLGMAGIKTNSRIFTMGDPVTTSIYLTGASFVAIAIAIFLVNPFKVGFAKFLIVNSSQDTLDYSPIWQFFSENYKEILKTTLIRDLYLLLWSIPYIFGVVISLLSQWLAKYFSVSLLPTIFSGLGAIVSLAGFIILIRKNYSFYMTNYILAENPDLSAKEIIERSEEMMQGAKFFTFVLELSFLGWYLLGLIPCGLGIFFVNPYQNATITQLYQELNGKGDYYNYKIIDP